MFRGETGVAGINVPGLWVTDGTAAGTTEIGGLKNAGISSAYSGGMLGYPPDFTLFNSGVLFQAQDKVGNLGLWVTDGTAAGTSELVV